MHYLEKLASGYYSNPKTTSWTSKEFRALAAEFKKDALEYHGLTSHPKAEQVYAFVYDHTSGYQEIHDMLEDISSWIVLSPGYGR